MTVAPALSPDDSEQPDPLDQLQRAFDLIAEGASALLGFAAVALMVVRGDEFVVVSVAANGIDGRILGEVVPSSELVGRSVPVDEILGSHPYAEDWGRFKFLTHSDQHIRAGGVWVPSVERSSDPDAWHPRDLIEAPLTGRDGALIGLLTLAVPFDRKLPDAARRRLMNGYADQADTVLRNAFVRERLEREARFAESARDLVRRASTEKTIDEIIEAIGEPLRDAFGAAVASIRLFSERGMPRFLRSYGEFVLPNDQVMTLGGNMMAPWLWELGEATIVGANQLRNTHSRAVPVEHIQKFLADAGLSSMLLVPIGAGPRCVGLFTLYRGIDEPEWTAAEYDTAVEIGLDLGALLAATNTLSREQEVVAALTELDAYKDNLVARISHELDEPLAAIMANLDLLGAGTGGEGLPETSEQYSRAVLASVQREAGRMARLIDNLLLLSKVADPNHPMDPRPVDLVPLTQRIVDLLQLSTSANQVIEFHPLDAPLVVDGDARELERMIANITHNAVKFMPQGGSVSIELSREGHDAVITVSDEGVGMTREELSHIFEEFYRSSRPEVRYFPGSGIGLAIVDRVVQRHDGRISVDSAEGEGTTVRVYLPAAIDEESEVRRFEWFRDTAPRLLNPGF